MNVTILKSQMEQSKFYAQYWLTSAQTGHCLQRNLFHGTSDSPENAFTDEEKLDDAMKTAKNHMRKYMELAEALAEFEEKSEKSA